LTNYGEMFDIYNIYQTTKDYYTFKNSLKHNAKRINRKKLIKHTTKNKEC